VPSTYGSLQITSLVDDRAEVVQGRMVELLATSLDLGNIPPDVLALALSCIAGFSPKCTRTRGVGAAVQRLAEVTLRESTTDAVMKHMPGMQIDRVVLVAHALELAGLRDAPMTSCMAQEVTKRFKEASPWALARAVALLEDDAGCRFAGEAVQAMFSAVEGWMTRAWGQHEFLEAAGIALERARVQQGSRKWKPPRVLLMLDASAAQAMERFENEKALQLLSLLSDAKLDDGRFIDAFVAKLNAPHKKNGQE
jgi:hypothetical protein